MSQGDPAATVSFVSRKEAQEAQTKEKMFNVVMSSESIIQKTIYEC